MSILFLPWCHGMTASDYYNGKPGGVAKYATINQVSGAMAMSYIRLMKNTRSDDRLVELDIFNLTRSNS